MTDKKELTLITCDEFEGYEFNEILEYLGGKNSGEANKFCKWISGQTMGVIDSKTIVYKWDWDKYIETGGVYISSESWD